MQYFKERRHKRRCFLLFKETSFKIYKPPSNDNFINVSSPIDASKTFEKHSEMFWKFWKIYRKTPTADFSISRTSSSTLTDLDMLI